MIKLSLSFQNHGSWIIIWSLDVVLSRSSSSSETTSLIYSYTYTKVIFDIYKVILITATAFI